MTWEHHFERTYGGLCKFLASLSDDQTTTAKVMPGRMIRHDIYGWDVFYPSAPVVKAEPRGPLREAVLARCGACGNWQRTVRDLETVGSVSVVGGEQKEDSARLGEPQPRSRDADHRGDDRG